MTTDPTESIRRGLIETGAVSEAAAEATAAAEQTWTTDELREDFEVIGFMAPFVTVRRKADGVVGSLMFDHSPRIYFNWREDT
jgi:hypothetical protein